MFFSILIGEALARRHLCVRKSRWDRALPQAGSHHRGLPALSRERRGAEGGASFGMTARSTGMSASRAGSRRKCAMRASSASAPRTRKRPTPKCCLSSSTGSNPQALRACGSGSAISASSRPLSTRSICPSNGADGSAAISRGPRTSRAFLSASAGEEEASEGPKALIAALGRLSEAEARAVVEDVLSLADIQPIGGRTAEEIAERFLEQAADASALALKRDTVRLIETFLAIKGAPEKALAFLAQARQRPGQDSREPRSAASSAGFRSSRAPESISSAQ